MIGLGIITIHYMGFRMRQNVFKVVSISISRSSEQSQNFYLLLCVVSVVNYVKIRQNKLKHNKNELYYCYC